MISKIFISDSYHTLVKAQLILDNHKFSGFFLIDTASPYNVVNKRWIDVLDIKIKSKDSVKINSLTNNEKIGTLVDADLLIENIAIKGDYSIIELTHPLFSSTETCVIGILGLDFLIQNNIVVDYSRLKIYTKDETLLSDYEQMGSIPFGYALQDYGYPVLPISNFKDDKLSLALLDSGSNINMICKSSINTVSSHVENLDIRNVIGDISDDFKTEIINLTFSLAYIKGNTFCLKEETDEFNIIVDRTEFINENNKQPIIALIGNTFLLSMQCIIDFVLFKVFFNAVKL